MRYVAFLRAINVGGRSVRMNELAAHFRAAGLADVETFIASGNVLFAASSQSSESLARKIEDRLGRSLGLSVPTFIRTQAQVQALAEYAVRLGSEPGSARELNVGFLAAPLTQVQANALRSLCSEGDELTTAGTEVFWHCQTLQSESKFSNAVLERTLNTRVTFRRASTVRRIAARLAGKDSE
jgi:uncharacterized protein (DUF1697 family)